MIVAWNYLANKKKVKIMQQCLSKSIDIFFIFWLGVYFGVIVELSGECFY